MRDGSRNGRPDAAAAPPPPQVAQAADPADTVDVQAKTRG